MDEIHNNSSVRDADNSVIGVCGSHEEEGEVGRYLGVDDCNDDRSSSHILEDFISSNAASLFSLVEGCDDGKFNEPQSESEMKIRTNNISDDDSEKSNSNLLFDSISSGSFENARGDISLETTIHDIDMDREMARLSPRAESAKDGQDNNLLQEVVVVVEALNDLNLNTKLHSATSLGVIENFDIDQTKLEQSMLNHLIKAEVDRLANEGVKSDPNQICKEFVCRLIKNINTHMPVGKVEFIDDALIWVDDTTTNTTTTTTATTVDDNKNDLPLNTTTTTTAIKCPTWIYEYLQHINDLLIKLRNGAGDSYNHFRRMKGVMKKATSTGVKDNEDHLEVSSEPDLFPLRESDDEHSERPKLCRYNLSSRVTSQLEQNFPEHPILNWERKQHLLDMNSQEINREDIIITYNREFHGDPIVAVALGVSGHSDHLMMLQYLKTSKSLDINGAVTETFFDLTEYVDIVSSDLSFEKSFILPQSVNDDLKAILPVLCNLGVDLTVGYGTDKMEYTSWLCPTKSGVPLFGSTHLLPPYYQTFCKCSDPSDCARHWQVLVLSRFSCWNTVNDIIQNTFDNRFIPCGLAPSDEGKVLDSLLSDVMTILNKPDSPRLEMIQFNIRSLIPTERHPFMLKPRTFFKLVMSLFSGANVMIYSQSLSTANSVVMTIMSTIPYMGSAGILTEADQDGLMNESKYNGVLQRIQLQHINNNILCLPTLPLPFKECLLKWLRNGENRRSYLIGCSHPLFLDPAIVQPDLIFNADSMAFYYDAGTKEMNNLVPSAGTEGGSIGQKGKELTDFQKKYLKNAASYIDICKHLVYPNLVEDDELKSCRSKSYASSFGWKLPTLRWMKKASPLPSLPENCFIAPIVNPDSLNNKIFHFKEHPDGLPLPPTCNLPAEICRSSLWDECDGLEAISDSFLYKLKIMKYRNYFLRFIGPDTDKIRELETRWFFTFSKSRHQFNLIGMLFFRYLEFLLRLCASVYNSYKLLGGVDGTTKFNLSSTKNPWIRDFGGDDFIRHVLTHSRFEQWRKLQQLPAVFEYKGSPKHHDYQWAHFKYRNGDVYTGTYRQGLRDGYGVYIMNEGHSYYEGMWKSNKRHGNGTFVKKDLIYYHGPWRYDNCHGNSDETIVARLRNSNDSDIFTGEFRKGKWFGNGTHLSSSGILYRGAFNRGLRHGLGQITQPNGLIVSGSFNRNQKHGVVVEVRGRLIFKCHYQNGKPNGKGVISLMSTGPNGIKGKSVAKLHGIWCEGILNGAGQLEIYDQDTGSCVYQLTGLWKDGRPDEKYNDWRIKWNDHRYYRGRIKFVIEGEAVEGTIVDYKIKKGTNVKITESDSTIENEAKGDRSPNESIMIENFEGIREKLLMNGILFNIHSTDDGNYKYNKGDGSVTKPTLEVDTIGDKEFIVKNIRHLPAIIPHGRDGKLRINDITYKGTFYLGMIQSNAIISSETDNWYFKGELGWGVVHGNGSWTIDKTNDTECISGLFSHGNFLMTKKEREIRGVSPPQKSEIDPKEWRIVKDFIDHDPLALYPELRPWFEQRKLYTTTTNTPTTTPTTTTNTTPTTTPTNTPTTTTTNTTSTPTQI